MTHDSPPTNYFLSCRPGRKVASTARNKSNETGKVCATAATARLSCPRCPADLPIVRLSDAKVHRELALALAAPQLAPVSRSLPHTKPRAHASPPATSPQKVGALSEDSPRTHKDERSRNIPRAPFPNSWRIPPPEFCRSGASLRRCDRPDPPRRLAFPTVSSSRRRSCCSLSARTSTNRCPGPADRPPGDL